jgi:23S rRNA (cytidine1920-2'-O)/16S rRNA (cytidine1409-2'-O)-methyltransferase
LPEKAILATIDVSFISVEKVIPSVPDLLEENGYLLVLVKPQFEAKPKDVGKGGVIKNPQIHAKVLGRFIAWATEHRFSLGGLLASPISGASGNKEFLILLKR